MTKSADATGLEDAMNKYEWHGSLRTYLPGCDECVFRSRCTGIFRVYLELHGEDEFQPVSREALLALDPERRNFVLLVEPHLARAARGPRRAEHARRRGGSSARAARTGDGRSRSCSCTTTARARASCSSRPAAAARP